MFKWKMFYKEQSEVEPEDLAQGVWLCMYYSHTADRYIFVEEVFDYERAKLLVGSDRAPREIDTYVCGAQIKR